MPKLNSIKIFIENTNKTLGKAGWTKAELARQTGVHPVHIGKLLSGTIEPSLESIERIADALGVTVADLLTEGKNTKPEPRKITFEQALEIVTRRLVMLDKSVKSIAEHLG